MGLAGGHCPTNVDYGVSALAHFFVFFVSYLCLLSEVEKRGKNNLSNFRRIGEVHGFDSTLFSGIKLQRHVQLFVGSFHY